MDIKINLKIFINFKIFFLLFKIVFILILNNLIFFYPATAEDLIIHVSGESSNSVIKKEEYTEDDFKNDDTLINFLNKISGLFITSDDSGSQTYLFIEGFSYKRILILLDYIPISFNYLNSLKLPLSIIKKIIIYKGNMSALFGPDAMGGVIIILTKNFKKQNIIYASSSLNTIENCENLIFLSEFNQNLIYGLNFNIQILNNDYLGSLPNNNFSGLFLKFSLRTKLFNFNTGFIIENTQLPGNIEFPFYDAYIKNSLYYINFKYKDLLFSLNYINKIYHNNDLLIPTDYDIKYTSIFSKYTILALPFVFNIENNFELLLDNSLKIIDSIFGENIVCRNRVSLRNIYNYSTRFFKFLAGFSIDIIYYARNERNLYLIPSFIGGIGFYFFKKKKKNLYLNFQIGTSFRLPDFKELFLNENIFAMGNDKLLPEKSYNFSFNINYTSINLETYLRTYISYVYDMIIWIPGIGFMWKPINIAKVLNYGLELNLNSPYIIYFKKYQFLIENIFNISAMYSLNLTKMENYYLKYLPYRPFLSLFYQLKLNDLEGFEISFQLKYISYRYTNFANTNILKGYFISNLNLNFKINYCCNLNITINNMFNQKYTDLIYYPSKNIFINFKFNGYL